MLRRTLMILVPLIAACGSPAEESAGEDLAELGTTQQKVALFEYSASNTTYATDPDYSADSFIYLNASETVMIGTCGITESSLTTGDSYLRLYNPSGVNVLSNDNGSSYGCGYGSKMSYTAPATGDYLIRAGCYSSTSCSGAVAISRQKGAYSFSVTNTNNATINTFNKQLSFNAGEVVRISTCASNSYGASASSDTYLRLFRNASGVYSQVASSDNAAGCGTASEIVYTIPTSGYYQFRAGCIANTSCSGTVTVYVE
jgi:hypothetical protein